MLIQSWLWWVLMIAFALAGLVGIGMLKVGGWSEGTRRERAITVALLGGIVVCLGMYVFHRNVVVCTERNGHVHATRMVEVGASGGGTVIQNHTSQTLQIVTAVYGLPFGTDPRDVPPNTTLHISDDVDDLGPDDPPPQQISSSSPVASRTWLTW